jgi:hypothetical protein
MRTALMSGCFLFALGAAADAANCIDLFQTTLKQSPDALSGNAEALEVYGRSGSAPPFSVEAMPKAIAPAGKLLGTLELGCKLPPGTEVQQLTTLMIGLRTIMVRLEERERLRTRPNTDPKPLEKLNLCEGQSLEIDGKECPVTGIKFR